jgi:type IV secretory pathway TraG/TraD family ATPase VirD4
MRSFFQLLSTKIVLQYDEPDGAKFIAEFFGEQEVIEKSENRMVTNAGERDIAQIQQKQSVKKVFIGGEFSTLPPLSAYIKISNFDITKITFDYLDIPDKNLIEPAEKIAYEPIYSSEEDDYELEHDDELNKLEIKEEERPSIPINNIDDPDNEAMNELAILTQTLGGNNER